MADSEIALGILKQAGYTLTQRPEDADIIVIFTCVVKKPTSDRMLYRINSLKHLVRSSWLRAAWSPERLRR